MGPGRKPKKMRNSATASEEKDKARSQQEDEEWEKSRLGSSQLYFQPWTLVLKCHRPSLLSLKSLYPNRVAYPAWGNTVQLCVNYSVLGGPREVVYGTK